MDRIMTEEELKRSIYKLELAKETMKAWETIKKDEKLLKHAMKVKKTEYDLDTVTSKIICSYILRDKTVNKDIYNELVNMIYSNRMIARTKTFDGFSSDVYSYLLVTIFNHNLELTEEQKKYIIDEIEKKWHGPYMKRAVLMNPN